MANGNPPFNIHLPEEVASGTYCNIVSLAHSPAEFVMDFIQMLPGMQQATVKSRVIMAPIHAKQLLMALQDNLKKYEQSFGEIELPQGGDAVPPMFGGGPAGIA